MQAARGDEEGRDTADSALGQPAPPASLTMSLPAADARRLSHRPSLSFVYHFKDGALKRTLVLFLPIL